MAFQNIQQETTTTTQPQQQAAPQQQQQTSQQNGQGQNQQGASLVIQGKRSFIIHLSNCCKKSSKIYRRCKSYFCLQKRKNGLVLELQKIS